MRKLIVLIALIVCAINNAQDYTVIHINSAWNSRNDYKELNKLKGVRIVKANLEDQQPSVRRQIKAIPVIFIYKDNSVIFSYSYLVIYSWSIIQAGAGSAKKPPNSSCSCR